MRLYYSPGACSMAPHIVLEEIGAPYESERVILAKGAHMTPEYAEINRWRRVPVLETEGERLTEAGPIMIYLADDAPAANLLPPVGSMARARALEYASWLASSVHIAFAAIWRPRRFLPEGDPSDAALKQTGIETVRGFFADIEARMAHDWALPGGYSIIDPYLAVFYRWGNRIGLDMKAYPRWTEWTARMRARPAVAKVMAEEGVRFDDPPM